MGPPLSIINEFIYMNVILPILKRESYGLTAGNHASMEISKERLTRMVIPKERLQGYLKANLPEMLTKNMRASWEVRISRILTSYEEYTRVVCGKSQSYDPRVCWEDHELKWDDFQLKLKSWDVNLPYYCVHY